jgi:hypothetical protein
LGLCGRELNEIKDAVSNSSECEILFTGSDLLENPNGRRRLRTRKKPTTWIIITSQVSCQGLFVALQLLRKIILLVETGQTHGRNNMTASKA